jgi:hypothetical protein
MSDGNLLHQIIAVEKDLEQQARAIVEEATNIFNKKADHCDGIMKVYKSYDEAGEKLPPESKEVVTTVKEKLDYTKESLTKAINTTLAREETNGSGRAVAELVVGNTNFGKLSATSFIALERYLEKIRDEYKAIPTLDATKSWNKESSSGRNLYISQDTTYRTTRSNVPLVMAPATDKHPAQVQLVQKDSQVGEYHTTYFSGRITSLEKSLLLGKIDDLIIAVKKAREQANQVKVVEVDIGKKIFDFING